jgi:hypothetical protein
LDADEILLAERLVDALVVLRRTEGEPEFPAGEYPPVRVAPLRRAQRRSDLFPWKIVIETGDPDPFCIR